MSGVRCQCAHGVCGVVDFEDYAAAGAGAAGTENADLHMTSVVRGPWSVVERRRTTDNGQRTLRPQLHVGPGGLAADFGGTHKQAEGAASAGGKLQAAEGAIVEAVDGGPHGGDNRRTERLDRGPQCVARILGAHDDHAREVNAPGRGGRRIESLLRVDDDEHTALPARFAGREQAESGGATAAFSPKPLDKHAVAQAAAGEQPVERGGAGGKYFQVGGPRG